MSRSLSYDSVTSHGVLILPTARVRLLQFRLYKKLFPLVTLIIMDVFIQKMRIKKNRKVLVIEEAWKAIASPMMAEYIKYLYKTARKFWASVGVVTQEIQDIVGSPIVKEAIINNSDVVMLLDQAKFRERFDEIKA